MLNVGISIAAFICIWGYLGFIAIRASLPRKTDWAIDNLKFFAWIQLVLGIVIVALLIEGFSTLSTVPMAPEIKAAFDRYATFLIIIIAFQFGLSFVFLMAIASMGGNLTALRENTTQMVGLLTSIRSNTANNEKTTDA